MKIRTTKLVALVLALAMMLSLAACGGSAPASSAGQEAPAPEAEAAQASQAEPAQPAASETESAAATQQEAEPEPVIETIGQPVYGGSLTTSFASFYNDYDPAASDLRGYVSYFYDRLWTYAWGKEDFTMKGSVGSMDDMEGGLAESWEFDPEAKTLTVHLHDNVFFQDKSVVGLEDFDIYHGRKLTSADVKWSYDRILGLDGVTQVTPDDTNYGSTFYMLESVEAPEELTVVFHFKDGTEMEENDFICNNIFIAGPEWDELTDEQKTDWRYACGTGPFLLKEYSTDSYMTFVKNENYWGHDSRYPENQLPYLDEVTIVHIADTSNQLSQFMAGEVDILAPNDLSASEVKQLEDTMDPESYVEPIYYSDVFALGLKQCDACPALRDIRVRQAMNLAMNLQEVNDEYLHFAPEMALSFAFGSSTPYCAADEWSEEAKETYYTQNIEKAKELLTEAGYPDGFEFSASIFSAMDSNLLELMREYLAQIGITCNLTVYNTPPEMTAVGADLTNPECINQMAGVATAESAAAAYHSGGAWCYLGEGDPTLDQMIDEMVSSTTMDERIAKGKEIDKYLMDNYYLLVLSPCQQSKDFYSTKVGGYTGEFLQSTANPGFTVSHLWDNTAGK